jgi:HlyD family secretion protein
MTATLAIEVDRLDNVLRVPASALRFRPSDEVLSAYTVGSEPSTPEPGRPGPMVWQLANGVLQPVRVRTGLSDGTSVAIVEGPLIEGAGGDQRPATPSTASAPASVHRWSCRCRVDRAHSGGEHHAAFQSWARRSRR